jgi:hypothetical protein
VIWTFLRSSDATPETILARNQPGYAGNKFPYCQNVRPDEIINRLYKFSNTATVCDDRIKQILPPSKIEHFLQCVKHLRNPWFKDLCEVHLISFEDVSSLPIQTPCIVILVNSVRGMYPGPTSNHASPDMSARLYMMYVKAPARAPRLGSTINSELRLPWRKLFITYPSSALSGPMRPSLRTKTVLNSM